MVFTDFNIWTPILVIIIGLLSRKTFLQGGYAAVKEKMLTWFMFFPVGLMSLYTAIIHIFFGNFTAEAIGWLPSPFQYEVGIANLAFWGSSHLK